MRKRSVHELRYKPYSSLFTSLAYLPSQSAETTWPLYTNPVPRMRSLSVVSLSTCTYSFFAYQDRHSPVLSPAGFITKTLGWTRQRANVRLPIVSFKSDPFFMGRFAGTTLPVANFLVENVFRILDDPTDDSQRGTREFGVWIRDLSTSSQLSTHIPVFPQRRLFLATAASAPASRRFPVRPPLPVARLPATCCSSCYLSKHCGLGS